MFTPETFSTDRETSAPEMVDKHMGETFDKMELNKWSNDDLMDIDDPDEPIVGDDSLTNKNKKQSNNYLSDTLKATGVDQNLMDIDYDDKLKVRPTVELLLEKHEENKVGIANMTD